MNRKEAYEALGLDPKAPAAELGKEAVTKAYRRMAMKHHPDRNAGDKAAEEKFKQVQKAYELLCEPQREEAFAGGDGRFSREFASGQFEDIFEQMFGAKSRGGKGGGFSGFSGFSGYADADGEFHSRADSSADGVDIEGRVQISLKKSLAGGAFSVSVTRPDGKEEIVSLRLRPGVAHGERVVAAGKGGAARGARGQPGDLVLTISVQPDAVFERVGDDLARGLQVPFARCALGGEVPVEMPDGSWLNVSIPQGASSGMKLRLRGKGAAKLAGGHGDLYCRVEPIAPKKILAKERKVWERLIALQEAADRPKD